jgi:hypothetical protein
MWDNWLHDVHDSEQPFGVMQFVFRPRIHGDETKDCCMQLVAIATSTVDIN